MSASRVIADLLAQRGIEDAANFVRPDFSEQHDAALMLGMDTAVERISQAIAKGERVAIFGDYDADGVPATALLTRILTGLGLEVIPLIPTRSAGYGLNDEAVSRIIATQCQLLITVDNGTVAVDEVAAIAAAGIDVIICDHHEPQEGHVATAAIAILNPKQPECRYPFDELCGCGLAWKLLWQLYIHLGKSPEPLKWELDLVAISTVADMVPLVGENRLLVQYGLLVLRKTRNAGIRALVEAAGIQLEAIGPGDIGFKIGPRINAPSRMHQDMIDGKSPSLEVLIAKTSEEAKRWAAHLNHCNGLRQELLDTQLAEAISLCESMLDDRCLVVYNPTFSSGVIGLIAGRLLEKYKRPVIVLANEGEWIKGSVRSVEGVHTVELLAASGEYLEKYGGHAKAGGLTMKRSNEVEAFRASCSEWVVAQGHTLATMEDACRKPADLPLPLQDADLELAKALIELEPFGIGFPLPLFETHCVLEGVRTMGQDGKHLMGMASENGVQRRVVGFGMGARATELSGGTVRARYHVTVNTYQGIESVNLSLQDVVLV